MITFHADVLRTFQGTSLAGIKAQASGGFYSSDLPPHLYPEGSIKRGVAFQMNGTKFYVTVEGDFKIQSTRENSKPAKTLNMTDEQKREFLAIISEHMKISPDFVSQVKANGKLREILKDCFPS